MTISKVYIETSIPSFYYEAINQIREVRHKISEEHEHDPQKLVAYYIELQKQFPNLVKFKDYQPETVQALQ